MLNENSRRSLLEDRQHGKIFYTNLPPANEQAETIVEMNFHHIQWHLNSYKLFKSVPLYELGH